MRCFKRVTLSFALIASTVCPTLAAAQSTGLEDMVGARAGQAEAELQRRGYVNTGGQQGDDRSYTNWWNADRRQCVTIATMNGRYDSITPTLPPDCRKSSNKGSRANSYGSDWRNRDRATGISDSSDLQALCRARASQRYDLRPSELTIVAPINQRNGSATVRGWFDAGKRTTFFTCNFDPDRRFIGLM